MATNYQLKTKKLASKLKARIEILESDDGKQIEITSPDGKVWDEGLMTLVSHYGGTWGKAHEAWEDLFYRMSGGLIDDHN